MLPSKTIVFIHGLFQNPVGWDRWISYFNTRGFVSHAPSYKFHDGVPANLCKTINPELGKLTFGDVINGLTAYIDRLPEKPILVGHSMGGLAVQKLLEMEKGVAGVAIDSAPPQGLLSFNWSFLRSNIPVLNYLKGDSVFFPTVEWFHYAFCNTMTREETQREYNFSVVPESRNIPRSTTGKDGKIDFKKPHKPLLMIAGEKDHIIPASLNRKNFNAYKDKGSKRDFKEFPGRSHYICAQQGWEEVAEYVHHWITEL